MSDSLKDHLEMFHEHDIYLPTRTITLMGEVNNNMHETLLKNLHALDQLKTPGTINLYINSDGGSVDSCMAIYDAISGCNNFVRGVVNGEASSSASIILQACDTRIITPNSCVMIHIGTEAYAEDHVLNIKRYIKRNLEVEKWFNKVYMEKIKIKHPRFTQIKLDKLLEFDTILSATECLDLGLVDEIRKLF